MMRQVSFLDDMGVIVSYEFDSEKMTDSEALHHLLCYYTPEDDDYTVKFNNYKPIQTLITPKVFPHN